MNKKTLLSGVAFVALGLVALTVLKSPEKGQRTGEGARPIPKLARGDFDTLVVTKDGKSTTVVREGDAYKLTAPLAFDADEGAAKEAFEGIETLAFGSIVTDQKAKHAEFEVGDSALRVTVQKGDKPVADLRIGKSSGAHTMVRLEGKDEVWQAKGALRFKYDRDTTSWRNKTISTFEESNVTGLSVSAADGSKIALAKPEPAPKAEGNEAAATDGGWKVEESSLKIDVLDKAIADGIVNALSSFRANDFADAEGPEVTGLASPKLTVTVKLKGNASATLLVGNKKGDEDYYVKKEGGDQVFVVKRWNLERINKRPLDFSDKTICNVPPGDVHEISVARKEDPFTLVRAGAGPDDWKVTQPRGLELDTSKASTIAGYFSAWKATGFAETTSPAATGLDKPVATITVKSKTPGVGCTLKVGRGTEDKASTYVQVPGGAEVYIVPQWQVDRVLPKKDDLKKTS
ncbi:MAG: DUF4340 domain-containing protein [Myxococcales bacterium]|nr:DUF4340 domain-containing protein [Myxococcales bacterium]